MKLVRVLLLLALVTLLVTCASSSGGTSGTGVLKISGTLLDDDGGALSGIKVDNPDATTGAVTDENGNFELEIKKKEKEREREQLSLSFSLDDELLGEAIVELPRGTLAASVLLEAKGGGKVEVDAVVVTEREPTPQATPAQPKQEKAATPHPEGPNPTAPAEPAPEPDPTAKKPKQAPTNPTPAGGDFTATPEFIPTAAPTSTAEPTPVTYLKGDMNCDGAVNDGDVNLFVEAIGDQEGWESNYPDCPWLNGDINGDGSVDFGDITPFTQLLEG